MRVSLSAIDFSSIASDGAFLYVHLQSHKTLLKVGTGNENTISGHIYGANCHFADDFAGLVSLQSFSYCLLKRDSDVL